MAKPKTYKCVRCLKTKPLNIKEFCKEPRSKLRYTTTCRKCINEKNRARQLELKQLAKDPNYPANPKHYRTTDKRNLELFKKKLKECKECKQVKDISLFMKRKTGKAYHRYLAKCKECMRSYAKIKSLERNVHIREFLYNYRITNGCFNCGNKDPRVLEFDHQRNKLFNLGKAHVTANITLTKVKAEVKKCVIRCSNCHKIRTHQEQDTWLYQKFMSSQAK